MKRIETFQGRHRNRPEPADTVKFLGTLKR